LLTLQRRHRSQEELACRKSY